MSGKKEPDLPKGVEKYNSKGRGIALKIDGAAKKAGGTWVHFSQDIWLNGQMLGQKGVCYAMVVTFLGRFKRGEKGMISFFETLAGR